MLPAMHLSLQEPSVATVEYPRMLEVARWNSVAASIIDVQQHSPPELYTLHVSLLI